MDNVILTAHVASASARFDPARRRRVGHEIALVLRGRWPRSCVNPSVLEKTTLVRWQPYSMERGPGAQRRANHARDETDIPLRRHHERHHPGLHAQGIRPLV